MQRTITHFEEVKFHSVKHGTCPGCGNKTSRKKTFYQTINPYNRTVDGIVKDRRTIVNELAAEAAAWRKLPTWHVRCELAGEENDDEGQDT